MAGIKDSDRVEDQVISSTIMINRDLPGSKRNIKLSELADIITSSTPTVVMESALFVYDNDHGFYKKVENAELYVEKNLDHNICSRLDTKQIKEIIAKIQRNPHIQIKADVFNSNDCLINCLNGVVDLSGDNPRMLPHSSQLRFTYCINAEHKVEFEEPEVFNAFCQSSLDDDPRKRLFLLETIGYTCSDSISGKCAIFYKGKPDSGKSIIGHFNTLLIGEENVSNVPLNHLADRFNKAELFGKKLNFCGEIKASKLVDISEFKRITGGDNIQGEFKGCNPFYFFPRCKLLFSGNALPGTREADATTAFTNRLVVLLFNQSIPQESEEFIESFSRAENSAMLFVEECCILGPTYRVFNVSLLAAYKQFCKKNGLDEYGREKFYTMLDSIPNVRSKRIRLDEENR